MNDSFIGVILGVVFIYLSFVMTCMFFLYYLPHSYISELIRKYVVKDNMN